jgi:hypothetical protein
MENNIITRLEALKNQSFRLSEWQLEDNKIYKLNNFRETQSNVILLTDKRTFNLLISEIEDFLEAIEIYKHKEGFIPTTNTEPQNFPSAQKQNINLVNFEATETQKKTQKALSDLIDLVLAGDQTAIPKAKAVCDIANTMVNMEKSQTELIKLATKRR